jgi:hypothetical protein
MVQKPVVRWFRFLTLPLFIVGVSTTILAAAKASSDLMFLAAAISAAGVGSLLVGRLLINHPDNPNNVIVGITAKTADAQEHEPPQHAVAHR